MLRRVWIDIDNPPQVQYLAPFAAAFRRLGSEVLITARDHGVAHELLRQRGLEFVGVGAHPGTARVLKVIGVFRRAGALAQLVRGWGADAALFATRSAALTASLLRIPAFALEDYEFSDLRAYRWTRCHVIHPFILEAALRKRGFEPGRLISYQGIKEDITFAGFDLDSVEPHRFTELHSSAAVRVLVRPPDDRSHYHRDASSELTRAALAHFAQQPDVAVVLSPRYPEQVRFIEGLAWRNRPVVLEEPVPFLHLLTAVDAVVTGGGTMAREAAYLGVPSFTIFRGELGAVDRYLEASGRLVVVSNRTALDRIRIERRPRLPVLASNPDVVDQIVEKVTAIAIRERR